MNSQPDLKIITRDAYTCLIDKELCVVEWCNISWFTPTDTIEFYDFVTFGNRLSKLSANDDSIYKPSIIGLF